MRNIQGFSALTKIGCARARVFSGPALSLSLSLSLSLNEDWAGLNFALISKEKY